jgi:hypothetical protein
MKNIAHTLIAVRIASRKEGFIAWHLLTDLIGCCMIRIDTLDH